MKYSNIDGIEIWQFNEIIEELGYYGNEIYTMGDLSELFTCDAEEAILMAFHGRRFGYPRDSFNPYDAFFTHDGCGNLVSIPENRLQDYIDQFRDDILEYVHNNEIELCEVEEDDEDEYLYTSECGYLGELFEKTLDK